MMTPVANRENPMTDKKKIISRESSTPLVKYSKCVMTLKAATVLTSHGQSMRVSKFVTGGKPHSTRNRQATTDKIKLTTWLRVMAEVMQLMAKYEPAMRKLPTYPAKMTPLSGEPR